MTPTFSINSRILKECKLKNCFVLLLSFLLIIYFCIFEQKPSIQMQQGLFTFHCIILFMISIDMIIVLAESNAAEFHPTWCLIHQRVFLKIAWLRDKVWNGKLVPKWLTTQMIIIFIICIISENNDKTCWIFAKRKKISEL